MKKKLMAIIMAVIMIIMTVPTFMFAEEGSVNFVITVKDKNGAPIENASVLITTKDAFTADGIFGAGVVNGRTDANGTIVFTDAEMSWHDLVYPFEIGKEYVLFAEYAQQGFSDPVFFTYDGEDVVKEIPTVYELVEFYNLTINSNNEEYGYADSYPYGVAENTTCYFKVWPNKGYQLKEFISTDIDVSTIKFDAVYNEYHFTMPAKDVEITAVFEPVDPNADPTIKINAPEQITVGVPAIFSITTTGGNKAGTFVLGKSTCENLDIIEKIEYLEPKDGKWYELKGDSFGPATGFPLGNFTSFFRVTFKEAGECPFTVQIVDVASTDRVIASDSATFVATAMPSDGIWVPNGGTVSPVPDSEGYYDVTGNKPYVPAENFIGYTPDFDYSNGFSTSAEFDVTGVNNFQWYFNINGTEGTQDGVAFEPHILFSGDGTTMKVVEAYTHFWDLDNVNGEGDELDHPSTALDIASEGNKFKVEVQYAPTADGKISVKYIINGVEVAEHTSPKMPYSVITSLGQTKTGANQVNLSDGTVRISRPVLTALSAPVSEYDITVSAKNGTVTAPKTAKEGDTVEIDCKADSGYHFVSIKADGITFKKVNGKYQFTMPANDVAVTVTFARNSSGGGSNGGSTDGDNDIDQGITDDPTIDTVLPDGTVIPGVKPVEPDVPKTENPKTGDSIFANLFF